MERREYEPIDVGVTMSQYGYWIVELSVSPWQRMNVMICEVGISPDKARALALTAALPALGRK
jgi:hypothetical protein